MKNGKLTMNILDVGAMYGYPCAQMFDPYEPTVLRMDPNRSVDKNGLDGLDLIIFGGGEDINPRLYGHKNVASHNPQSEPSAREKWEIELVNKNIERDSPIPMLGICRGAQFLCVMYGGWLIQDVNHHAGANHPLFIERTLDDSEDTTIFANSYHHQMMVPNSENSLVIASTKCGTRYKFDTTAVGDGIGFGFNPERDPEVVYFNSYHENGKTRALGIQGHPEYLNCNDVFSRKCRWWVKHFLGVCK